MQPTAMTRPIPKFKNAAPAEPSGDDLRLELLSEAFASERISALCNRLSVISPTQASHGRVDGGEGPATECRTDSISPHPPRSRSSDGSTTIADNIANMNTVGFRATGVSFKSELKHG